MALRKENVIVVPPDNGAQPIQPVSMRVFIRSDGSQEMNVACVKKLISLGHASISKNHYEQMTKDYDKQVFFGSGHFSETKGTVIYFDVTDAPFLETNCKEIFLVDNTPYPIFVNEDTKHKHYENIVKWASNPSLKVWSAAGNEWFECIQPIKWNPNSIYVVGEKPEKLNCLTEEEASRLHKVYVSHPTVDEMFIVYTKVSKTLIDRGLVFSNELAAVEHSKKMLGVK